MGKGPGIGREGGRVPGIGNGPGPDTGTTTTGPTRRDESICEKSTFRGVPEKNKFLIGDNFEFMILNCHSFLPGRGASG